MPITKAISSKTNTKQVTNADFPINPNQIVTSSYGPVSSSSGQTIINLTFAVSTTNTANFFLYINGSLMSLGSGNDYTFTSIQANGTSSQVTMNQSLPANLNIQAFYLGVVTPNYSLSTITASVNSLTAVSKNHLINGNFDLWQRGTSGTVANGVSTYLADRWYVKNSLGTSGVITNSQIAGVNTGATWGNKVQITTAPTAAQTNGCELYQVIDNENTLLLLNKTLSFSAQIKAFGNVIAVGMQFMYATTEAKTTLTLGAEQSVTVNTSTFSLGSLLAQNVGTTPTSSGVVGVRIRILTVSTGNLYDLNNGFVVEQAIANTGSTIATFERAGRNFSDEVLMCQRYYEKSYDLATNPASAPNFAGATCGVNTSGGAFVLCPVFKTPKRITNATVVLYNPQTGTVGQGRDDSSNNITSSPGNIGQGNMEVTSSTTGGANSGVHQHWTIDADI